MSEQKVIKKTSNSPSKFKTFTSGIMPTLSKLSKAFLLPIALLPIAGVFLGVGATIANEASDGSFLWYLGSTMNKMGDVAFGNLPVLFCISVAIAYTEDSGVAAITSVVGFLVFNGIQAALITGNYEATGFKEASEWQNGWIWDKDKGEWLKLTGYNMLWWKDIPTGIITNNVGIPSLNTGVFAAIFIGAVSAYSFNRFHKTQLPSAFSFFSGSKLVPIMAFFMVIPLSFVFLIIWPPIGLGLAWFGNASGKLPIGLDSLIYEIIERSLVPFGLHHVFYAPLWWSSAGGDLGDAMNAIANDPEKIKAIFGDPTAYQAVLDAFAKDGAPVGDQTILYWVLGHSNIINFKQVQELGINLGRFQSGKFPFMMFGLPMAGLAMWLNVPKDNRKAVMGIYFSAAFTCFLTGITEPIEFTFLFLAPWLFYGVHMPLAAISFMLTGLMKVHVGMTVSGGFIDYIVFGLVPYASGTHALHVLWIGAIMAPAYFFAFYFAVKYGNVMVPGRDGSNLGNLFTKADVKAKRANGNSSSAKEEAVIEKSTKIIEFLGGKDNITNVDSCASRLRLTVVDSSLVNVEGIKSLGGCTGVIVKGTSVHAVYGGEQEVLKPHIKEILAEQRKNNI